MLYFISHRTEAYDRHSRGYEIKNHKLYINFDDTENTEFTYVGETKIGNLVLLFQRKIYKLNFSLNLSYAANKNNAKLLFLIPAGEQKEGGEKFV